MKIWRARWGGPLGWPGHGQVAIPLLVLAAAGTLGPAACAGGHEPGARAPPAPSTGAPPAPSTGGARSELAEHLEGRRGEEVDAVAELTFTSVRDGWRGSGLVVEPGQGVTVFGRGALEAGERTLGARDVLWLRIGDGEAFSVGSDADSFVAARGGELALAVRLPGVRWQDCRGAFPAGFAESAAGSVGVDLGVVVASWRAPLAQGLAALAGHERVAAALEDHRSKPALPSGFQSLCHLRDARVFSAFREGGRVGIRGLAAGAAGIVKKPLDVPLGPDTELSFEWRYDTLPALGPEDDARHHDYSSIALEFDNGQDLTWMWSSGIATGGGSTTCAQWAASSPAASSASGSCRWRRPCGSTC
jgi:hypothetical protein